MRSGLRGTAGMHVRALRWVLMLLLAGCSAAPMHPPAPSRAGGEGAGARAPEAASGFEARSGVLANRHMVASANPLASEAGLRMLRAGGSAVDAAIAVQMVLTLVEPQSSGIGGGLFLVHHDGRRVQTFDGRETAPAEATPDLFLAAGKPVPFMQAVVGGRAVGTPGVLRALELAHAQHGRLPWPEPLPAGDRTGRNAGFAVSPRLATLLRSESARFLRQDPRASALFFAPDGTPLLRRTTQLRNPELAATLPRRGRARQRRAARR